MKYKNINDVEWIFPTKKKPFAYSTKATSDLIEILSEQYLTIKDVFNNINYDEDAKQITKQFIDAGYENFIMYDLVHINKDKIYRKLINNETIKEIPLKDIEKNLDIPSLENEDFLFI